MRRVPGAETLAAWAFTLYLTHKAVAHTTQLKFARITSAHGPASWLLYAFSCLLTAWLLHVAVERPFLRLRDRSAARQNTPALEAEALNEPAL